MLGILKTTQHNPAATWRFVPLQDFSTSSDIDWSKPVSDIDSQLYSKYDLSDDEIEFIESHIKAPFNQIIRNREYRRYRPAPR